MTGVILANDPVILASWCVISSTSSASDVLFTSSRRLGCGDEPFRPCSRFSFRLYVVSPPLKVHSGHFPLRETFPREFSPYGTSYWSFSKPFVLTLHGLESWLEVLESLLTPCSQL